MTYRELASKYITENDGFYQDAESMARRNGIRDFGSWLDMQRGLTTHEAVKPHIPSSDSKPCSDCGEIGGHKWTCPQF